MLLCIRCCGHVQSFLCKFFRYRPSEACSYSCFSNHFTGTEASDPIWKPPTHRCLPCPEAPINNWRHHRQSYFCPVRVPDPSCSLTSFISPSSKSVTILPRYWKNPQLHRLRSLRHFRSLSPFQSVRRLSHPRHGNRKRLRLPTAYRYLCRLYRSARYPAV